MRYIYRFVGIIGWLAAVATAGRADDAPPETLRYVRPAGTRFVTECDVQFTTDAKGWTVVSRTDRGNTRMEVEARYDADDRLLGAKAVLSAGGKAHTAAVRVADGKATVTRDGHDPASFDAPKGLIVTSAPDWSDIVMLCRRYDRARKGKQEFPALWVHPVQVPLRQTFSIEWQGTDSVDRDGTKTELDRHTIRIRNNSAYMAWADATGRLVRLVPLPWKETTPGMTLDGFEQAAALRPPK